MNKEPTIYRLFKDYKADILFWRWTWNAGEINGNSELKTLLFVRQMHLICFGDKPEKKYVN